ncbi:MAG: DUF3179 domain-containing protein [Chloroflexi bacterium]|nr:DUF3179 domain-containing protein [Chloroflexota bacterium]
MQGRRLTFGVSGKLIMNALVMYDRETDSLWSQILGEAVQGPLKGTRLEVIPVMQTTWRLWRDLHPETLVLSVASRGDPYVGYYASGDAGILGQSLPDRRVGTKEFVLGLKLGDRVKAYPFRALSRQPVVNDELAGTPLLVTFEADSATGQAFERRVAGQTLTFDEAGRRAAQLLVRDRETATLWSGVTGQALEGPLAGQQLTRVPSHYAFWFGWHDFYPDTELFE